MHKNHNVLFTLQNWSLQICSWKFEPQCFGLFRMEKWHRLSRLVLSLIMKF